MNKYAPIGVFDSGYGGLTVLSEIKKHLPQYDYLYLGDNARSPYGTRSFDVVYEYTLDAVNELFSRGCELVILACNTASAKALRTIQQQDLPKIDPNKRVLGVIRPSAEVIGSLTKSGNVGILATEGTVRSESYVMELDKYSPNVNVFQLACPMWVPIIENQKHESPAGQLFIQEDVKELLAQNPKIDTILLGCTHYPIIQDYIQSLVGNDVRIVAQGPLVAQKLTDYLNRHPELEQRFSKSGDVTYLTTENKDVFNRNAGHFLGEQISAIHVKI
jgi:glutamate racemase